MWCVGLPLAVWCRILKPEAKRVEKQCCKPQLAAAKTSASEKDMTATLILFWFLLHLISGQSQSLPVIHFDATTHEPSHNAAAPCIHHISASFSSASNEFFMQLPAVLWAGRGDLRPPAGAGDSFDLRWWRRQVLLF